MGTKQRARPKKRTLKIAKLRYSKTRIDRRWSWIRFPRRRKKNEEIPQRIPKVDGWKKENKRAREDRRWRRLITWVEGNLRARSIKIGIAKIKRRAQNNKRCIKRRAKTQKIYGNATLIWRKVKSSSRDIKEIETRRSRSFQTRSFPI